MPQHPMVDDNNFGSFGTINTIRGLAAYFDVNFVCWNQKTLRNPVALQQAVVHEHKSDSPFDMSKHNMSPSQIVAFSRSDPRVMHIEWNGTNHYSALVGPTPTPINAEIKNGLLQVTPVTTVNPKTITRPRIATPKGYAQFTDLFRKDIVVTSMSQKFFRTCEITNAHVARMCAASNAKYHGVALITKQTGEQVRCFCQMVPGMYDSSDFGKTGDFTANLFINKAFMQKYKATKPPGDNGASCKCGIYYEKSMAEVQCTACGVWDHAECVAEPSDLEDLEGFATGYVCSRCVV